ncbi:MAG: O-antigen ligase family protein [Sandaracinaceae bacterium]|nr:O-antigen ligase family protein [Sandaracinaceae bacterium]
MRESEERLSNAPSSRRKRRAPNHRSDKTRHAFDIAALSVFGVTLVGCPLLLGGATPWAVWASAGLSALSLLSAIAVRQPSVYEARLPLAIALVVALGWTTLQALPLPCAALRLISPNTASEAYAAARALGEGAPAMCTLSLDPGQTRIELVKLASMLACFVAAALFSSSGMRRRVHFLVAASVITMMCAAFAHWLFQLDRVFGLYRPVYADSTLLAPLMNPNHLAAFVGMGAPLLVAFGMREEHNRLKRTLWYFATALSVVCVGATLSLSGIGSLVIGLAVFALLLQLRRRGRKRSRATMAFAVAFIAIGFTIAAGSLTKVVSSPSSGQGVTRATLVGAGFARAVRNPIFGIGRGAYVAASANEGDAQRRVTSPENVIAQWSSEWGFVVAAFLFFVIGRELYKRARIHPSTVSLAVLACILSLASHELFDFSTEMLGISIVGATLLGSLIAPSGTNVDDFATVAGEGIRIRHLAAPSLAVVLIGALALGPMLTRWSSDDARERLIGYMRVDDRARFHNTLSDAVSLHPAEPSLALLAGAEAREHADPNALRWLNRAMLLAPRWASPHVEAARVLIASGHQDQALLELREAAQRDARSAIDLACSIVRRDPSPALAMRSVPTGRNREAYLDAIGACLPPTSAGVLAIDRELLRVAPRHPSPRVRAIRGQLAQHHFDEAIAEARALSRENPGLMDATAVYAEALMGGRRFPEAIEVLRRDESRFEDPSTLVRLRARAEAGRGDAQHMRAAIDELRGLASGSRHELASVMILLAQLETQLGNDGQALAAYDEAFEFQPHISILEALAKSAERQGNREKAYQAYTQLVELVPTNESYRAARTRLVGSRPILGL